VKKVLPSRVQGILSLTMAEQSETILYAKVRPSAVECPFDEGSCGAHNPECADLCGGALAATRGQLEQWGYHCDSQLSWRELTVYTPAHLVTQVKDFLKGVLAWNGQPLFESSVAHESTAPSHPLSGPRANFAAAHMQEPERPQWPADCAANSYE